MDNSRCRCYRARPVFNLDNKVVVRNAASGAVGSDRAPVPLLRPVCRRVDVARQGPGARDVLLRPGASVRGGAASRHRDRRRRRNVRARPCGGRRHLRRHGADERADAHDSDRRRARGELDPPRLDRGRAQRARRRGRRRRHRRPERYRGVRRAVRAPRHPHCVERPGLPRPSRLSPGRDGPSARDGARAAVADGRPHGPCGRRADARPCCGGAGARSCGAAGSAVRTGGRGSRCSSGSACEARDDGRVDPGAAGAAGGAVGGPRPRFTPVAARACRARRQPRSARARAVSGSRARRDADRSRACPRPECACAQGRARLASCGGSGHRPSRRSPARSAGPARGFAKRGSSGSLRRRPAPRHRDRARRAPRAGGRSHSELPGRSYDHEPVSTQ